MMLAEPLAADAEVQVEGLRPWQVRSYLSPAIHLLRSSLNAPPILRTRDRLFKKKETHLPFEKAASPCIGRVQNDEGRKKKFSAKKIPC